MTTQPLSDDRAVMLHLALCNIASADPGPESVQSLAHEMALIARQAIGHYLKTAARTDHAEQAAETQRLREAIDRQSRYLRHEGLCGIVGGYGYCTCGLDDARTALNGKDKS
jgi:predicted xylose isomerase-like sugar epimerase